MPAAKRRPQKVRVLVVSDDELARLVQRALRPGTFSTERAKAVADAQTLISSWRPQVVVVDVDLDRGRGIEMIEQARTAAARATGVMAITRRGDMRTKLDAFDHGADDVVVAPFAPEELVARTLALQRRVAGARESVAVLTLGDLEIDLLKRRVVVKGRQIHLSSLEQALLFLLAANAGEVLTRERILDTIWGADYSGDSSVVDQYVRSLRVRLGDDARKPRYIETVPGNGYRFIATSLNA